MSRSRRNLGIRGAESKAALGEGGGVSLAGGGELVSDQIEVGGGRAVAETNDGEDFSARLEVLPGAWRGAPEHELETEAASLPRLVGEGALLVLRVEGAY